MPNSTSRDYKVHFLPNDTEVEVPSGSTILDAAHKADVYINTICGGDGICGKCKVILTEGEVDSPPTTLLSRDQIQKNYVLACEAKIKSDIEILIPEETRLEGGKILRDEDAERFGTLSAKPEGDGRFRPDPLVKKFYLELSPPTMEDNLPDHERLYRAIKLNDDRIKEMQTGFKVLKQLPTMLQKSNWHVTATVAWRKAISELVQVEPDNASNRNLGIAVDVGTTTVVAHLLNLATGETIATEATYNSQMKYGEDYIARIIYATQNDAFEEMRESIVDDINDLITVLTDVSKVNLNDIMAIICSGNTAMIHFLLGLDPRRIRKEPYVPSANFIPPIRAAEAGIRINGRGLLYCVPSVAAYVGGDITAGALAVRLDLSDEVCLFIDIGTNGEVVLGNRKWMVCCSASAGPAFEGSGVKHGMRAARGAIEKLVINVDPKASENYEVAYQVIGDQKPIGLCGSGLLDCIAELFTSGIIDRTGSFHKGINTHRLRETEEGLEFVLVPKDDAGIDSDVVITQHDIQNLMRSKAAIYAAISVLVESIGMTIDAVDKVYLAGGFGNYLNVENAIIIGMLPDIPISKVKFVGNTSVTGAKMAILSIEAYETLSQIASQMTYFDLMGNPKFMEEFIQANFLPHTNIEEFPSVVKRLKDKA